MSAITINDLDNLTKEDLIEGMARWEHLAFMRYCWQKKESEPFAVGIHTKAFCEHIDRAMRKLRNGESSFILGQVCFGHGKSEIVSNYLPPHFIGEFPDYDVLVTSYSDSKVSEFSSFGRKLMDSEEFKTLYPDVALEERNVNTWSIQNHHGRINFSGIDGSMMGKRGRLIIVDDYIKNREEAESAGMRDKLWSAFTNNIMSRRASTCIVFVLCTPWHVDDIAGRIKKKMIEDDNFPQFEIIQFPAMSDKYESGYLFPEKYSKQWYMDSEKLLGAYGTSSLMQCNPVKRGGNMFRTDKINFYDKVEDIPHVNIRFKRAWDLASSVKQTDKQDPDFTVGVKGSVVFVPSAIKNVSVPIIVIDDIVRGRWEATLRQTIIRDVAIADGVIEVGIEGFAAYKDAFTQLEEILKGIRSVKKMLLSGDKKVKADPLVPAFEAGNVWMRRASWNNQLISEIESFPSGVHDDQVDAMAVLFGMFKGGSIQVF